MLARTILCLACLLISALAFSQTLTSTVDRNRLSANQTLNLKISYDGSTRTDALDLSAVRQDFDVLSTSSGSSFQLINGQTSRITSWDLVLLPKRTGNLIIPSFNLGNIVSDAIQIEVVDVNEAAATDDQMSVELWVDRSDAKVGEQILVKIKLRARANLADLAGEELKVEDADIQLVNQQDYGEVENGISWRVIEWTYALFPQSSGSLAIPKQMFTATIPSTQRRSFFDSFALRGQRIARRSEAAAINVSEPVDNADHWFPASNVSISSSWTSDPASLTVGEPLTRIVEIIAESQLAAAIPPLTPATQTNYKEYQDQPALENRQGTDGITGVRRESSAIVPSEEGLIEFPAQIIRWWDITRNQWQEARLPAESYQVSPAAIDQSFSPPQNFEAAPVFSLDGGEQSLTTPAAINRNQSLWMWATITLAVVVLLQTLYMLRSRSGLAPAPSKQNRAVSSESERQAWSQLETALKLNDAGEIRNCILGWARTRWTNQPVHTLDSIAARSSSEAFKTALLTLDQILFNGSSARPSADILHSELKRLRNRKTDTEEKPELDPLYPQPF